MKNLAHKKEFIAHVRKIDGSVQPLYTHLTETAEIAKNLAEKIGLPQCGELVGLLHDFGKYSHAFQEYIIKCIEYDKQTSSISNLDEDEEIEGKPRRGSVDHSTAGAQFLYGLFNRAGSETTRHGKTYKKNEGALLADVLFICVASHHSGLVNVVDNKENAYLIKRKKKTEESTHFKEAQKNGKEILNLLNKKKLETTLKEFISAISPLLNKANKQIISAYELDFYLGFMTRLLFSCLIDADRSNSIAFEYPYQKKWLTYQKPNWQLAIGKLEAIYQGFEAKKGESLSKVNQQRQHIAQTCKKHATNTQGIYSLTVPTGGGKTLSSLRFALHHAQKHDLDRIIYIIPYTSIIEQNASEIRKILEEAGHEGDWVLEHHANLEPHRQTWQSKLIMDNWNTPIIFTTMVQFLETCFSGGTKGVRRLHQLTHAVLVFDEIQTLPISCYHLFCNAVNYLTNHTNTTAVLCSATQPILDKLPEAVRHKGRLNTPTEIIGDTKKLTTLFDVLERVDVIDCTEQQRDEQDMATFVKEIFYQSESTLIIVNTKAWAKSLYQILSQSLKTTHPDSIFHLSTGQCAKHRKDLIHNIKLRLKAGQPTLVISTQLIEAGVDISFKSVIRFVAGLDSIAQASGRCNRHGELKDKQGNPKKGQVFIVYPQSENISKLPTITHGKERTLHMLNSIRQDKTKPSLLDHRVMDNYFHSFYSNDTMQNEMAYSVKGQADSIMNWLSSNPLNNIANNQNTNRINHGIYPELWQSFMDAGDAFKAIDAPTTAIVVPYKKERDISQINSENTSTSNGVELIAKLHGSQVSNKDFYKQVKEAQQYSVNVFPHLFNKLAEVNAVHQVRDTGIFTLNEQFYDALMGLNPEGNSDMDFLEM